MASKGSRESTRLSAAGVAVHERVASKPLSAPNGPTLDINDPRYPRRSWRRALRTLAHRSPLLLLAYPALILVNVFLALFRSGPLALFHSATYIDAALLSWVASLPALYLVPITALLVLIVATLVYLSGLALHDQRQEHAVMEQRTIDLRLTQTRLHMVADLSESAMHRSPKPSRGRASDGEAVATLSPDVPNDLERLPEPAVFVGRAEELAWLGTRLQQGGVIAVTDATGAGGVGVSSLVARAVRQAQALGRLTDGIVVFPCAGQKD